MFVLKRNQIIITALVVMVAVAGYLTWMDNGTTPTTASIALNDEGEVVALIPSTSGYTEYVEVSTLTQDNLTDGLVIDVDENPEIAIDEGANTDTDPGAAVFVSSNIDSTYFLQAKLDREQARSKQKEILTDMINNTNVEQTQRAECASAMLEIQKRIEKETAAEAMIEAKGFKEVYVRIDDETVDVVVSKEALSDAEIAQIEDIVKRKTGMKAEQIRISPIKK